MGGASMQASGRREFLGTFGQAAAMVGLPHGQLVARLSAEQVTRWGPWVAERRSSTTVAVWRVEGGDL